MEAYNDRVVVGRRIHVRLGDRLVEVAVPLGGVNNVVVVLEDTRLIGVDVPDVYSGHFEVEREGGKRPVQQALLAEEHQRVAVLRGQPVLDQVGHQSRLIEGDDRILGGVAVEVAGQEHVEITGGAYALEHEFDQRVRLIGASEVVGALAVTLILVGTHGIARALRLEVIVDDRELVAESRERLCDRRTVGRKHGVL